MRKAVQFLCGFAVFAAIFFSWLWTLSFVNRVNIYRDRDKYKPETFLVTGAEFERGDATEMLVQGESLRVVAATPDFWQYEARLRHRLGLLVLVPVPVTLGIYLVVRYLNRRHARLHSQQNAA
jgi:hypothetical protein